MAELSVSGGLTVGSLKNRFKKEFGLTLRVYYGSKFADEKATLASLRKEGGAKSGDLKVSGNMQVGNFEKKFLDTYGIKIQVATGDDSKLINDVMTLSQASKEWGK